MDGFLTWWTAEAAVAIRKGIETLQRRFGDEAAQVMVQALKDAETAVEERTT